MAHHSITLKILNAVCRLCFDHDPEMMGGESWPSMVLTPIAPRLRWRSRAGSEHEHERAKFLVSRNLELKALCPDASLVDRSLAGKGFRREISRQRDHYFVTNGSYLKLRYLDDQPRFLILYSRSISPTARPSEYQKIELNQAPLVKALCALSEVGVVRKTRIQFRRNDALVNLDNVESFGHVVEIEVFGGNSAPSRALLENLRQLIEISASHVIPYSNIHLVNMTRLSQSFVRDFPEGMRLFLLDGPSASGKSTLMHALLQRSKASWLYVRRDTTRAPRAGDEHTDDYNFVSPSTYFSRALAGKYMECRDYDFGMSYGVSWHEISRLLPRAPNVLALINLGNGPLVKRMVPTSTTILLTASPQTIERRLRERSTLTEAQIHERVLNAKSAIEFSSAYDLVFDTDLISVDDIVEAIWSSQS